MSGKVHKNFIDASQCVAGVLKPDMQAHLSAGRPDTSSAIYKAVVRIQSRYRGFAVRKVVGSRLPVQMQQCNLQSDLGMADISVL